MKKKRQHPLLPSALTHTKPLRNFERNPTLTYNDRTQKSQKNKKVTVHVPSGHMTS